MRQHPPRTGRTSFPTLEQEMLRQGIDPTRLDIWMESRSRGKGVQDDNDTEDLHAQFTRKLSEKPELERTKEFKEQIFENALGKERAGRVRCKGRGVTPSKFHKQNVANNAQRELFEREKDDLQKFKEKINEEMLQVKEGLIRDKEELHLEKEKTIKLNEKLELLISQYSKSLAPQSIESQLPNASSSPRSHFSGIRDSPVVEQHQLPNTQSSERSCILEIRNNLSSSEMQQVIIKENIAKTKKPDVKSPIQLGASIYIFSHGIPKTIVAEAVLIAMLDVKNGFCKVYVKKALKPVERLMIPLHSALTIGEVVGKSVIWKLVNIMEMYKSSS